jgi:hypothetical protein
MPMEMLWRHITATRYTHWTYLRHPIDVYVMGPLCYTFP